MLSSEDPDDGAELICLNVAGIEVGRHLLGDVDSLRSLQLSLASELSLQPFRLKFLLPDGNCLQSMDDLDDLSL
jgi:hypothetical protein